MFTILNLVIAGVASSLMPILWSLIFVPLYFVKLYKISDSCKISLVFSRLSKNCSYVEEDQLRGWIWGKYYIGYVMPSESQHGSESCQIYIVCTQKCYNELITDNAGSTSTNMITINVAERFGTYCYFYYKQRQIPFNNYTARPDQQVIVESIEDLYEQKDSITVVINGEAGAGKSMISLLLSTKIGGTVCDTWNPCDPGDNISKLYNSVNPTRNTPLIVVLEEFDIIINKIHKGEYRMHKDIPTSVYNKATWNTLLDKLSMNYYPYTIVIMTTNVDPTVIDKTDSSYIRSGRVTKRYSLQNAK